MLERKTFCVISGASRGLGRSIALEFSGRLGAGSVIAVFARNGDQLRELKQQIEGLHPQVTVHTTVVDLTSVEEGWYKTIFLTILQETHSGEAKDFQQALIINNAATGDVSKLAVEYGDKKELDLYFSLNLASPIVLTSNFLQLFTDQCTPHRYVVNLSSSAATRAVKSLSTYGAGKAARLMFFRVLAEEEPNIRVLTYNPGTLDTDMQKNIRENAVDPDVRAIVTSLPLAMEYRDHVAIIHDEKYPLVDFLHIAAEPIMNENLFVNKANTEFTHVHLAEMYENGELLSTEHSASCLAELLETDNYISGDHTEIQQESALRALTYYAPPISRVAPPTYRSGWDRSISELPDYQFPENYTGLRIQRDSEIRHLGRSEHILCTLACFEVSYCPNSTDVVRKKQGQMEYI